MKKKEPNVTGIVLALMAVFIAVSCGGGGDQSMTDGDNPVEEYVQVVSYDSLTVYYPNYSRIDLVMGSMPKKRQVDVIFCCAGSFTGESIKEFRHSNIAGDHVSGGIYYEGYKCGPYNGVFTWSKESGGRFFNYSYKNARPPLEKAAEENGMGYCQTILFFNGRRFPGCFKPETTKRYRALCQIGKRLCIVDCSRPLPFGHFLDGLEKLHVRNALYCDMGYGWSYSWYRKPNGKVKELFHTKGRYATNWITFYK